MNLRGGRRVPDRGGSAPLIVVIDEDSARRDVAEGILARCHFAVAPFYSVETALVSMRTLRAEAVIASVPAAARLRVRLPTGQAGRPIPMLPITSHTIQQDLLVESLRGLLRRARYS
ncbi:MAG: hypothetical protein LAO77_11135 [Acidobacteriia bacterium]|nr:hypothetical protein [Terriglobia bacterium]